MPRNRPFRRRTAALLGWLALAAGPAAAAVVVEAVRPPTGATSPLAAGDHVLSWRSAGLAPPRAGELAHWGELDQLPLVESPRATLELAVERGGVRRLEELPPGAWTLRGRPLAAAPELVALVATFSGEGAVPAADEVERRVSAEPAEVQSWIWARFGEACGRRSDWRSAQAAFARAVALSPPAVAADLGRFHGDALRRLGKTDEAEAAYRRALETWNRLEPSGLGASTALTALGNLRAAGYDLGAAHRLLTEATAIRRRLAPGSWLHANALNNLGALAGRRNDLAAAEELLLEALALAERGQGDPAPLYANLGSIARLRGEVERSEMYTRRAIELFRAAGNLPEVVAKLTNLGNLLGDAGRLDEALAALGEALSVLAGPAPDRQALGTLRANRAKLHLLRGDRVAAALDLEAARALFGFDTPRTDTEALVTSLEAELAEGRGALDDAARLAEITLAARARLQPDSGQEALAASALARIREAEGRLAEAERLHRRAIAALERQQQRLGGEDRGLAAFRAKHAGIYRAYLELLLRLARTGEAFELYERSRAQALLTLLRERDLDLPAAELPAPLRRRRAALALEIDRSYRALAKLPDEDEAGREQARLALERLHAERVELAREAHAASPRLAAIEAPPALGLDEIRRGLAPGTLLVAYAVGSRGSTLFALDRDGALAAHSLGAREAELAADIRRWAELVTSTSLRRGELRTVEERLSRALLGPVADRIARAERLLVVPDGPLHGLAFAALPLPGEPGRRLVEALPISHQVSASVHAHLGRLGRRERAPGGSVAVFADPATPEVAASRLRRDLGPLPAARREAAGVEAVYGARARLFVGAAATEAAVREETATATLSHFACHAVVDEALPLDSALVLAPAAGDGGLLQAWEIAEQLRLGSDLVVLSACETARGGARGGEGILGLVRAFQVAGARSVLASLWRVDDEATAELMTRFHRELAAGVPADEALRRAQVGLMQGPVEVDRGGARVRLRTDAPRFWAPFVLVGPGD
ncbi:MAG TPA: CHAT domain-containing protein [Thermoanaerobaculia bacterium]|nr:CHAT domain-containing protein [Thermoanaerobaculia bacterium]